MLLRVVISLAVAAAAAGQPALAAEEPWLGAAFAAEPRAMLAAAERLPASPNAPVLVLTEEGTQVLDGAGARTYRYRIVYRVLSPQALESWDSVQATWAPWHEARPELEARVITSEGGVHLLDAATIAESGLGETSPAVYSDTRKLQAPLPAVAVGAVVEYTITWRENQPPFAGGRHGSFRFGSRVPTRHVRFVVDAPAALPLPHVARLLPALQPRRSEANGRVRIAFEGGPYEALPDPEPGMPPDEPRRPYVAYSTGASWAEVAAAYARLVDARLAGAVLDVREATAGARDRGEVIDRLLAGVRRDVRYTGVEFGESTIAPQPPAEVRRRRYGDCKDQAALLVALLRAAGIASHVALLLTGPGEDVDVELPGVGEFNHAIVYVPGPTPGSGDLWIDPTDPQAPAGELPDPDQGRMALVAMPATRALLRTPEASAADNQLRELRDFQLASVGKAKVVETTELTGSFARSYRSDYGSASAGEIRKRLTEYARSEYLGELSRVEHSDPQTLAGPFRLRLEMANAGRGATDETLAVVAFHPSGLTEELPEVLRREAADATPRRKDYVVAVPFVCERRYHVVPPPGFVADKLPPERELKLGPARYTARFSPAPGGAVDAVLRFESGKRRLTPDEYAALREGVRALRAEPVAFIRFPQVGEAHLQAGRIREAIAEFRALARSAPKSADPHVRLARALLAGGLGEAARAEAKRATELEPRSALAHQTLGWVLQHDAVGRRFEKGFDLAGAVAEYRRARELDPQNAIARADLAILLEHDAEGVRYSPRARLAEAAAEYRALRTELKDLRFDDNWLLCLAWAGAFEELAREVRSVEASPLRDGLRVLSAAATAGAPAALQEAERSVSEAEPRRKAIEWAGSTLVQLRQYPLAAKLLPEAAKGAPNAAALRGQADLLARVRRFEDLRFDPADPSSLPRRLTIAVLAPGRSRSEIDGLMSRRLLTPSGRDEVAGVTRVLTRQIRAQKVPVEVALDVGLAMTRVEKDGDDAVGYRLRVINEGPQPTNSRLFALREDGQVRAIGSSQSLGEPVAEGLARLDAGDLAGARRWLDWVREEIPSPAGTDPLAGSPFARLWQVGQQGSAAEVRRAAASLLVLQPARRAAAAAWLAEARGRAEDDAVRLACDDALALGSLFADDWKGLLAVSERLPVGGSLTAFRYRAAALRNLGRWEELEQLARRRLAERPGDDEARRTLARVAHGRGDLLAASTIRRQLESEGRADPVDLNEIAWDALFLREPLEPAIAVARRAVDATHRGEADVLHTLATLYAEADRAAEALETITEAIGLSPDGQPRAVDWWVFGRLAESYGVPEEAASLYRRVQGSGAEATDASSTWRLAQRRLASLPPVRP